MFVSIAKGHGAGGLTSTFVQGSLERALNSFISRRSADMVRRFEKKGRREVCWQGVVEERERERERDGGGRDSMYGCMYLGR